MEDILPILIVNLQWASGSNKKKGLQDKTCNPLILLVGQGGVEPPTLGFSVDHLKLAIPRHLDALIFQALMKSFQVLLAFVRLFSVLTVTV
jgi:hypothetical protein